MALVKCVTCILFTGKTIVVRLEDKCITFDFKNYQIRDLTVS